MTAVVARMRRSKGAQMLSRMGTQNEIGLMVGCSHVLVGCWLRGDRVPAAHWRDILTQMFSIPFGAWDLPVPSNISPALSLRQQIARELAPWPEAYARVDAILRKAGVR